MAVEKVVITVAGSGSRLLPVTKSQPKEMLPVGRKPAVQYVVEEALAAGLKQVLFVTGRQKQSIEDHFDRDLELEQRLAAVGRGDAQEDLAFSRAEGRFFFVRQPAPTGLADAVGLAEDFVGDGAFAVSLGDSIIATDQPGRLWERMTRAQEETGAACVLALEEVSAEEGLRYGVVETSGGDGREWVVVKDVVEKPLKLAAGTAPTIAARYVFSRDVFACIRGCPPDPRTGFRELTGAIRMLIQQGRPVVGVRLEGHERRYDVGDFSSYFQAFVEFALRDEKYGYALRQYLARRYQEGELTAEGLGVVGLPRHARDGG